MAARRFVLPNIEELTKDQERVRLLPMQGRHLVAGGPGTGKSVVALLRARRHHRASSQGAGAGKDYVFLAYNKLLLAASRELMGGEVNARPWINWFKGIYATALREDCPTYGKPWDLDWQAVGQAIGTADDVPDAVPPYLVIDEGQDMPRDFYHALANLGFEHFFVVADQNQQITEQHSSMREIADALDIDAKDRIELRDNFRNAYPVARLAQALRVADPASPAPRLPPVRRSTRTPVLIDYGPGCEWSFDAVVERILKAADRDPARLFGIITPDNEARGRWLQALREAPVALDNGRPRIVTYASGDGGGDLRFAEGGLFVINAQSAKGLEFDSVILADIHRYRGNPEDRHHMDELRRRFYVLVSRARERVVLLREAGRRCPADAILPDDPDLLLRRGRS